MIRIIATIIAFAGCGFICALLIHMAVQITRQFGLEFWLYCIGGTTIFFIWIFSIVVAISEGEKR